ncbi:guanylate kinase [Corynebacterium aquatimens]|uniref:Guanylate kinase n=1 Tax=Corynebacterium aquatimens TaxID=1190508 RepID=A0A931DWR1_9CORY|nr:guanylate kinase [Corynebacterium aquatimens]MBG6121682.1 guanylate kinase [Corynebacterium aquatimens]WJY65779.1 Guanylate kinase [Corynebacterium aquatimens]
MNTKGRLVVLAGPSAVGKSTVVNRLRDDVKDLYFSVSMTTRAPRPGEVDGRDYFFVTPENFQERIDAGEMLEWADIHGGLQRSGTPAQPVRSALDAGRPVLVEVDLEGARNIKAMMPEAVTVFLAPPSWEILVQRLTGRGTEPEEVIERRLNTAREELAAQGEFDGVVVNNELDAAVKQISDILLGGTARVVGHTVNNHLDAADSNAAEENQL